MANHFNQLTPTEAELLALLAEECGEVVQAVGKILRHGLESRPPVTDDGRLLDTNRVALCRELGDVSAVMILLFSAGLVEQGSMHGFMDAKLDRIDAYLHHVKVTVKAKRVPK